MKAEPNVTSLPWGFKPSRPLQGCEVRAPAFNAPPSYGAGVPRAVPVPLWRPHPAGGLTNHKMVAPGLLMGPGTGCRELGELPPRQVCGPCPLGLVCQL